MAHPLPGDAVRLTWEPRAYQVDASGFRVETANVGAALDSGESGLEDAPAPLVRFALPGDAVPCLLEAEVEAADA